MSRESFRGVSFPPLLVAPLPKGLPRTLNCSGCDREHAVWYLAAASGITPICSLCVLYEVPWDGKDSAEIEAFVSTLEDVQGVCFLKDAGGRLVSCADADRFVSALVLTGKVLSVREVRK